MAKLSYYVKLRHNRKKHRKIEQYRYAVNQQINNAKKWRNWSAIQPTDIQSLALYKAREILAMNKHKSRSKVIELLQQSLPVAVNVEVKRFTMSGGVGSFRWMPKIRKYRLQIAASKISTKKNPIDMLRVSKYRMSKMSQKLTNVNDILPYQCRKIKKYNRAMVIMLNF